MAEAKARTSATEFNAWKEYLRRDANGFHRTDHYLARVCYQLYLIMHMMGGKPKLSEKDFFIKFEAVKDDGPADTTTEELDQVGRSVEMKRNVLAALGLGAGKGTPEATTAPDHVVVAGERDPLPPVRGGGIPPQVREALARRSNLRPRNP